jgi:hypothetical protein
VHHSEGLQEIKIFNSVEVLLHFIELSLKIRMVTLEEGTRISNNKTALEGAVTSAEEVISLGWEDRTQALEGNR